jgi:hypothetical protein
MELGEYDMKHKLDEMKTKWEEVKPEHKETIVNDIYEMIDDMATVLADFNRCECFWIFVCIWFVNNIIAQITMIYLIVPN